MHFAFTEDQRMMRDAVADMLRDVCTPARVRSAFNDGTGRVPTAWAKLAEIGVLGMTASEAWGGLGLGEIDLVGVLEACGRAALPDPIVDTVAVGVPLLEEVGGDALCDRWIGPVAAGTATIAVGFEAARYVCHRADLYVLERDGALYAAPAAGVALERVEAVDRARSLYAVERFEGMLLARGTAARPALEAAFDRGAAATAAQLCGLADALIATTVDYAKVRQQFGRPIGSFQAIKHQLADALVQLELARPLVYRAAWSLAHRTDDRGVRVSAAKAFASDAASLAARAALQCHGAIGYSHEYHLHLWMKRVWALAGAWGDAAFHRARVERAILGRGGQS